MLLTILKFAALLWLAVLVTSSLILASLFVYTRSAAAIRRRLVRRP
jgi:hypothetical protein